MPYIYSALIIAAIYFLVRYWDKKKQKDLNDQLKKEHEKFKDWLLDDENSYS